MMAVRISNCTEGLSDGVFNTYVYRINELLLQLLVQGLENRFKDQGMCT
jgi:hypothetical protein